MTASKEVNLECSLSQYRAGLAEMPKIPSSEGLLTSKGRLVIRDLDEGGKPLTTMVHSDHGYLQ